MPNARVTRIVLAGLGWLAVSAYLAQYSRLGPNHVDGGLLLGYIQTIADGGRPYFDFLDLYGLASWPLPALFYVAAGQKVWGLRLWLVLAKLAALALTFALVRRLADRVHAVLAVLVLTLLLGLPWQLLQTTYAFLPALALELAVAWLLLAPPDLASPGQRTSVVRLVLAGVLIGLTLCVKLNSGAFLWAGAMFVAFFVPAIPRGGLAPRRALYPPTDSDARAARWDRLVRLAQYSGLLAYGLLFHVFIRAHYSALYAIYLSFPLALMLGWTAFHLPAPGLFLPQLRRWAVIALVPPATAFGLLWAYLGASLPAYVRDTLGVLSRLSYVSPIPPIGKPGQYVGFNEFYWPQFPWLISALFGLWWWRSSRATGGLSEGDVSPRRSSVSGLFALYVCNLFVMYSRTDESHLHQAMLLGVPTVSVITAGLLARLPRYAPSRLLPWGFAAFACLTLGATPPPFLMDARGEWQSPRLAAIRYQRHPDPHVLPFAPGVDMHAWDRGVDMAATYLRDGAGDGAEVLVLGRNELLTFASHTVPAGGRYRYLFYLVKNGHFERADFLALAPPGLLEGLSTRPPAAIVTAYGDDRMQRLFPEIHTLLTNKYVLGRKFSHLSIYWLQSGSRSSGARPKPPTTLDK